MLKRSLILIVLGIGMTLLSGGIAHAAGGSYTSLSVFGWSKDGKYWAFGEQGDYSGGAMVGQTAKIYVVDVAKNDFRNKYEKEVSERTGVQNEDEIEGGIEAFTRQSRGKMKALGIDRIMGQEVYKKRTATLVEGDTKIRQFGGKSVSFNSGGKSFQLKLRDEVFTDEENPWASKSKFTLSIRRKGGSWKVLQADSKPWRNFVAYRIIYVSVSPDTKHIAVVIEAIQNAFENAKIPHYKAVAGALP